MRQLRCVVLGVLTVSLVAAATGCGSGTAVTVTPASSAGTSSADPNAPVPDAKTLVYDARKAYRAATSAHLHATVRDSGRQVVDIRGTIDGSNQEMTVQDDQGVRATVRTVDDKYYVKGNRTFWTASAGARSETATVLAGKWVLSSGAKRNGFPLLTIRKMLDDMIGEKSLSDSELAAMTTRRSTLDSTTVYVATSTQPAEADSVTVDADDRHEVAAVAGHGDDGTSGSARFDGWNSQRRVSAPKGYLDFGQGGPTDNPSI